uniref:HAT C-terminal dimerisation domain-containing protein n=1 Tax=Magallana gigas TaxID=29159 RepID=K1Q395_MAGGI
MKESVNSEGLAEVAYTADELSEKRKMNIRCRVHPTNARFVKSVSAFFILYTPLSNASLARSLLVGCQGEMLWTDLYRIRMFPQFENLLKEKDASCTVGHADDCLPHETERVDSWWGVIKKSGQYSALSKVAIAACAIFHGPIVESSFNTMGDIMDPKSSNMAV